MDDIKSKSKSFTFILFTLFALLIYLCIDFIYLFTFSTFFSLFIYFINFYFCFIDYAKAFDCVDHIKLWKILKEWE